MNSSWSLTLILIAIINIVSALLISAGAFVLFMNFADQADIGTTASLALLGAAVFLTFLPALSFIFYVGRGLARLNEQSAYVLAKAAENDMPASLGLFDQVTEALRAGVTSMSKEREEIEAQLIEREQDRVGKYMQDIEASIASLQLACSDTQDRLRSASEEAEKRSGSISDAAERLNASVDDVKSQAVSAFDTLTRQTDDVLGTFEASTSAQLDGLKDRVDDSFKDLEAIAGNNLAKHQESLDALIADTDILLKSQASDLALQIQSAADASDKQVKAMIERSDKAAADGAEAITALSDKLTTVSETLQTSTDRLDACSGQFIDLDMAGLSDSIETLRGISGSVTTLEDDAKAAYDKLDHLIGAQLEHVEALKAKGAADADAVGELVGRMKQEFEEGKSSVVSFIEEIRKSVFMERRRLDHTFETVTKQLEARGDNLEQMDQTFQKTLQSVDQASSDWSASVKETMEAQVDRSVTGLLDSMKAHVDGLKSDLANSMADLHGHAASLIDHQTEFSERKRNESDAAFDAICSKMTDGVEHHLESLEAKLSEIGTRIDTGVHSVAGKLTSIYEDSQSLSTKTLEDAQALATRTVETVEEQLDALKEAGASAQRFAALMKTAEEQVARRGALLETSSQQFMKMSEQFEDRIPALIERSTQSLESVAQAAADKGTSLDNFYANLTRDGAKLTGIVERLEPFDFETYRVEMGEITGKLSAIARNMPLLGREVAATVYAKLGEQMDAFSNHYGAYSDSIQEALDRFDKQMNDADSGLSPELAAEFESLAKLVETASASDTSASQTLLSEQQTLSNKLADIQSLIVTLAEQSLDGAKFAEITGLLSSSEAGVAKTLEKLEATEALLKEQKSLSSKLSDIQSLIVALKEQAPDGAKFAEITGLLSSSGAGVSKTLEKLDATEKRLIALDKSVAGTAETVKDTLNKDLKNLVDPVRALLADKMTALTNMMNTQPSGGVDPGALKALTSTVADIKAAVTDTRASAQTFSTKTGFERLESLLKQSEARLSAALTGINSAAAPAEAQDGVDLSAVITELEALKDISRSLEAMMGAQSETILSLPTAVDRLENMEALYRTKNLLQGRSVGIKEQDLAFHEISDLFDKIEDEAESVAREMVERPAGKTNGADKTLARLMEHKNNIDSWAAQLRNISTALAISQDAAGSS